MGNFKCAFAQVFYLFLTIIHNSQSSRLYNEERITKLRQGVLDTFYHAYNGYINHAYPYDELRPLSCDGVDTWGSYSLTLIDALDTLGIIGNVSEFERVTNLVIQNIDFDVNINVSVFETNIRVIGGLISAHLMTRRLGVNLEKGWPCDGPLLRLAVDVAKRILPAFDTPTGMPYGTVNLKYGVPQDETTVTCTAGVGTFVLEFTALSRLTGDPIFEETALRALYALWNYRSEIGLFGNHIDVASGKWTATDSGIGAGVDSYFEYLLKGSMLLQNRDLYSMFQQSYHAIEKYLRHDDWYVWVTMAKGQVTLPIFQSLEAFWPGMLSFIGEIDKAMRSLHNYHQVWKQYGFTPEFYSIPESEVTNSRSAYPLRPELIESVMYLSRVADDPWLFSVGEDILQSIKHSAKTECGYATVKDVRVHHLEDRMESFFLAETTKYLYLLFDRGHYLHNKGNQGVLVKTKHGHCIVEAGGHIFNTEAHPIDPGALSCCTPASETEFDDYDENEILALLNPHYKYHRPQKSPPQQESIPTVNKDSEANAPEEMPSGGEQPKAPEEKPSNGEQPKAPEEMPGSSEPPKAPFSLDRFRIDIAQYFISSQYNATKKTLGQPTLTCQGRPYLRFMYILGEVYDVLP